MADYKYVNPSKNKLEKQLFKYSKPYSTDEEDAYILLVPAYRYNAHVSLQARLIVYLPSGKTRIDIIDSNGGGLYAPYYYYDFGDYTPLLKIVDRNLNKELVRLGIKKYE